MRLIDVAELQKHHGAFELNDFKYTAKKHIDKCKAVLFDQYYADVTEVFLMGDKKKKLPDPTNKKKLTCFFNAVASIMTHQLQTLCLKSLYDYVEYITDVKVMN